MILTDRPEEVCAWLWQHNGTAEHHSACQTFGWWNAEGELRAALAFHHATERSCLCDIVLLDGWFPPRLLFLGLWYPFGQLGLRRLTFHVAESNLKSIALVEKLGAYREATLQDGCSDGDAYIYCLRPNNCKIWSKLDGKIQRKRASGP